MRGKFEPYACIEIEIQFFSYLNLSHESAPKKAKCVSGPLLKNTGCVKTILGFGWVVGKLIMVHVLTEKLCFSFPQSDLVDGFDTFEMENSEFGTEKEPLGTEKEPLGGEKEP